MHGIHRESGALGKQAQFTWGEARGPKVEIALGPGVVLERGSLVVDAGGGIKVLPGFDVSHHEVGIERGHREPTTCAQRTAETDEHVMFLVTAAE